MRQARRTRRRWLRRKRLATMGRMLKRKKKKNKFGQLSEKKEEKLKTMFKAMLEKQNIQLRKSDMSAEERSAVKEVNSESKEKAVQKS